MGQRQQIKGMIYTIISLLIIFVLNLIVFIVTGKGIPCVFRLVTGWMCPGCGMTHAFAELVKGDVHKAIEYNILSISLLPVLGFYLLFRAVRTIKTGNEGFKIWEYIFLFAMFAITIGFGIYRNIV